MKKCYQCKKTKTKNSFRSNVSICSHCSKIREQRSIEIKTLVLEYLRAHPCVDCGETNPVCLDFDHTKGIKKLSISNMLSRDYSWKTIIDEIAKCEVRCANCHRIKTGREFNHWVYQQEYGDGK